MMKKCVFEKYKQIFNNVPTTAKNTNEPNVVKRKIIVTKIPLTNETDENEKKLGYGRMNSSLIKKNENLPIDNNNNKNTITVNLNYGKKTSSSNLNSKINNENSKTARVQSCEDIPKVYIQINKKADKISTVNNENNITRKTSNKIDSSKNIEINNNNKYNKTSQYKRRTSTINEHTFNRLHDLQLLIKKESALKELCKLFSYNI